jgi:NAD(P)-dependent dehydrogenase (short-subunit alcohol dehydrogenase family)
VPATATDSETWSRVININFNGPFYLIRACLPIMLSNLGKYKGSIVNICSVAAVRGAAGGPAYTASKVKYQTNVIRYNIF